MVDHQQELGNISTTSFVSNITGGLGEADLWRLFQQYGRIKHEEEKAFEEETKKEINYISSLKETVEKEAEQFNLEMKRLENERKQIILDHERRDKEWAELNDSIQQLKDQRVKLEKQRELLHGDREEILEKIEELKKLEDVKDKSYQHFCNDDRQLWVYDRPYY
ncbi:hypothetical protein L1887_15800 [Cichorium endivia]|nr:hypothetical protein L1887_15800 [Cichorium endivia]